MEEEKKKKPQEKCLSHDPECWKGRTKKKRNGPHVGFSGGELNAREIITKDQIFSI